MDEMCCLSFSSWQIFFLDNVSLLSCRFFSLSLFPFFLFFFSSLSGLHQTSTFDKYFPPNRPPCLPTKMPLPHLTWYQPLC